MRKASVSSVITAFLAASVVSAACSGSGETARPVPDSANYATPCSGPKDCTAVPVQECSNACAVPRAVLVTKRSAFENDVQAYRASCSEVVPASACASPEIVAWQVFAACSAGACVVAAPPAPVSAASFTAGCVTDADCVEAGAGRSACCSTACPMYVAASQKQAYDAKVASHDTECQKLSGGVSCGPYPCAPLRPARCVEEQGGTRNCREATP
jgi:hypothetical protein